MNAPKAVYLIGPAGSSRQEARKALALGDTRVFDDVDAFLPLSAREPGVVVVSRLESSPGWLAPLLLAVAREGAPWTVALPASDEDGDRFVTLSPGFAYGLDELGMVARGGGAAPFTLPEVVERVRRARHDINNPLAAALAETQLLRMDATDAALVEALDAIQEQLGRIKGMVAALQEVRGPSGQPSRGP